MREARVLPYKTFRTRLDVPVLPTRYALVPVITKFEGAVIVETADPSIETDPVSDEHAIVM